MSSGGFFRRLPIRHKLVTMIMLTSGTVLVLASVGYLATDYYRSRTLLLEDLRTQGRLLLENSRAAIAFRDVEAANDTLRTLSPNPHIRIACLYDERGRLFTEYRPHGDSGSCTHQRQPDAYEFERNRLEVTTSIWTEGKLAGTLRLATDLEHVTSRLRVQVALVGFLLMVTLAVALFLSARLQTLVSQPVMALAKTASDISSRDDYSLRAERSTEDELGTLVDSFNRMLERIEAHGAELSKANEELRHEVAERRRAEQERADLLVREREANRLKDEFLATLSHELRTPLNAILGWTKLLRANAVPAVSLDRALEKIERNAQVQTRLVEDLLEISRIASGKLRLEMREFDLISLAKTAIDSIRPTAEARGVLIERRFDRPSISTFGDPDRLQQVIWNLLSNAVKFTPAGGTVAIAVHRDDGFDEISVSDTGIGIDPEFLPSVFDTFRQADASPTRSHGGLGLGLSIVKHLVDMHGGDVVAESEGVNRGSTFRVRLPVRTVPAEPAPVPATAPLATGLLKGATILVVDDDADTRELLASALETAGARVGLAPSADEGLTQALELLPDALVSDIAMPGQDGYALLRQMTAALGARTPRARVALTAFAGPNDREKAVAAGFQRHLAKPFDPLALVTILHELLLRGASVAGR
jgi:signal transduction histidine kinase